MIQLSSVKFDWVTFLTVRFFYNTVKLLWLQGVAGSLESNVPYAFVFSKDIRHIWITKQCIADKRRARFARLSSAKNRRWRSTCWQFTASSGTATLLSLNPTSWAALTIQCEPVLYKGRNKSSLRYPARRRSAAAWNGKAVTLNSRVSYRNAKGLVSCSAVYRGRSCPVAQSTAPGFRRSTCA